MYMYALPVNAVRGKASRRAAAGSRAEQRATPGNSPARLVPPTPYCCCSSVTLARVGVGGPTTRETRRDPGETSKCGSARPETARMGSHCQGWRSCAPAPAPALLLLPLLLLLLADHGFARTTHFSDGDEVPVYANKVGCARVLSTRGSAHWDHAATRGSGAETHLNTPRVVTGGTIRQSERNIQLLRPAVLSAQQHGGTEAVAGRDTEGRRAHAVIVRRAFQE